jgi:uncharacterized protein YbjQ (UPF0145 family)
VEIRARSFRFLAKTATHEIGTSPLFHSNVIKDIKASIKDFFGGRSGSYERVLIEAKETSLKEMTARAQSMGANAIVGIDIDYETVGESGSMLMVATSGTAVVI